MTKHQNFKRQFNFFYLSKCLRDAILWSIDRSKFITVFQYFLIILALNLRFFFQLSEISALKVQIRKLATTRSRLSLDIFYQRSRRFALLLRVFLFDTNRQTFYVNTVCEIWYENLANATLFPRVYAFLRRKLFDDQIIRKNENYYKIWDRICFKNYRANIYRKERFLDHGLEH